MADLIIGENNRLVRQDIISQNKGYNTSDRYVSIQTKEVLDIITEIEPEAKVTGWVNSNVRKKEKESFQRHAMMIRMPNSEIISGVHSNLVLFNSSDRSSALKMYSGAFRAVCSNGIVFSDTGEAMSELSIRHTNKEWKSLVYQLMAEYAENQEQTRKMVEEMQKKYMSYGDMGRLAERVTEEILNPIITGTVIDPMQLLIAKRVEDTPKDLWTVFNKMQEHLLQGGITRIVEKVDEDDDQGRLMVTESNTHKIKDATKQIKVNRALHAMAMEVL
jgi:hypothetical protein